MKKFILVIFLFIPILLKASTIESLYIDSELDISGNLIVKEVVKFDDVDKDLNIYYLNDIKEKYRSSDILLEKVGILSDISNISYFYDEEFYDKYITATEEYSTNKENGYLNIKFNNKNTYYLEYTILNVALRYNDASELYFKYLNKFNYNIKEGIIVFKLPTKSELFKVYSHSNYKAKVGMDKNNSTAVIRLINFKEDKDLDLRVIFDKDIFSIVINKDRIIDGNIIDIAKKEERNLFIYFLLVILFLLSILIVLILYSHFEIDVTRYDIKDKRIDKDLKLLVLSDLHDRNINDKLVKIIKEEDPDYIICSGDIIDGRYITDREFRKTDVFINLCKRLSDYNIIYTYGNHEFYVTKEYSKEYRKKLDQTNVNILNNKCVKLTKNIKISGLVYDKKYYNRRKYTLTDEYIESQVGKIDKKNYNILIAHNPLTCEPYSNYGFDTTISGHVHGGVIRIFTGLLSPEYRFFPKYSAGLYKIKDMNLIVSRGIGYAKSLPIRINNPAEVVIINLIKE